VTEGFTAVEAMLAARATGDFCFGSQPTLADICLVPQCANARRFDVPMDAFPRIRSIDAACRALPAFERARPENNPDAE
jgi:glutathione S-transferase